MPTVRAIADHLDRYLRVADYPDERSGALTASTTLTALEADVSRIGLALDVADAVRLARSERLDALLLHRAWGHDQSGLPRSLPLLAYHLPFDDRLTVGDNPFLAWGLGMTSVESIGLTGHRVLGMIGDIQPVSANVLHDRLAATFGALEEWAPPARARVGRVAVVGAMTAPLVEEASRRGADVYVTGQFRVPAHAAVDATGIGVAAVGHARAERWGLRCLARVIGAAWPELQVVTLPDGA